MTAPVEYSSAVGETAAAAGLGNCTGTGAISGNFDTMTDVFANGDNFNYLIRDVSGPKWEMGVGKWTTGNHVIREFVIASSESNNNKVNFTAPSYIFALGSQTLITGETVSTLY